MFLVMFSKNESLQVIAVPAHFDEVQRRATLKAAEIAGLDQVQLLQGARQILLKKNTFVKYQHAMRIQNVKANKLFLQTPLHRSSLHHKSAYPLSICMQGYVNPLTRLTKCVQSL